MSRLRAVFVILACVSLVEAQALFAECPNFGPVAHYPAATSPRSIAVADFNGDGIPDYATANSGSNTVSVRLGDGNGGFGTATAPAVGSGPYGIVAADFDRDGRIDLATANSGTGSNSVSVLLGNGSGGFATALTSNVGSTPRSIATADFNRDGKLDLAVANNGSRSVSILIGVGDGTFTPNPVLVAGQLPVFVAIADFNGNGLPDLAVANAGSSVVDNGNTVAIFNGFANGTFAAAVYYPVDAPNAIATGDFDGNGSIDLAVTRTSAPTTILLNDGSGGFTAAAGTADSADFVLAGDFSGDGNVDLALLHTHAMTIALGNGGGAFAGGGTEFPIGGNIQTSMASGDFNRDGRIDLAATDWSANDVAVFLNNSHCAANCASFISGGAFTAGAGPNGVATGDFNHDGFPDVATANLGSNNLSILLGNVSGFGAPLSVPIGTPSSSVAVADLNRDGFLEAIVSNPTAQSFTAVPSNGTTYSMAAKNAGFAIYSVAVADFNRDGLPDLVFASPNNNSAIVYTTVGPGIAFNGPFLHTVGSTPFFVAAADVNGDGKADIISANAGTDDVTVRLGDGSGGFGLAANYGAGDGPMFIAVADFNRDGRPDLAVANSNANTISILLGVGAGAFGAPTDYTVGELPRSIAVADLDLDGNPDLAVVNQFANTLMVMKGSATGAFTIMPEYGTGTNPASVATADFNRDGKLDLVVANNVGTNISLLTNSCPAAELTVVKSHTGDFTVGQVGAQYTMVVTNSGGNASTAGPVTVVDSLPAGLVATALSGTDWSCNLATLTCTRTSVLAQGASTPPIILTVNVRSSAPALVTNTATVSAAIELNPDNNVSANPTVVNADPNAGPTYLTATAESISQVNLTWDGVAGAAHYVVFRTENGTPQELVRVATTTYPDIAVSPDTAYVYQVAAVDESTNNPRTGSNKDLASTIFFTDDPLTPLVRAVHFTELRSAVQAVRAAAGLPAATFTASIAAGTIISAVHLSQLRSSMDEARQAIGLSQLAYTDTGLAAGVTTIKAAHIVELRSAVK